RESRVSRNDGAVLSEMAVMAKSLGMFVGVALDDDIAGADGRNSSISSNFTIDYLDQEHLYKIVDAHIFSKNSQMLPVLRDIYAYYREVLPGFRWSEQRFTSLYPLHPATLEIAPLIRLYINDFALLGFAADAGVRIMGRPANSLIGLDEVFDSVESKLRLVDELAEAFAIFDRVEREVVAKTPVQLRLPAKLILKGLLILSLNGQGASASEIAASMMVFSEGGMGLQGTDITALLDSFVDTFPGSIDRTGRGNQDAKYCLRLSAQLDGEAALATSAKDVPDDVIWNILSRVTADKFADYDAAHEFGRYISHCSVEWSGSIRRGEISWFVTDQPTNSDPQKETPDWTVRVLRHSDPINDEAEGNAFTPVIWRTAELSDDERETIGKLYLLNNDSNIREQFGDGLSKVIHVHSIATEKIWQRVFFEDGSLFDGDAEYLFSHDARSAHSLAHMLSQMLGPIFEMRYPEHPLFKDVLGVKEAANLIAQFFGGSGSNNAETIRLAEAYAVPLGLAIKGSDGYHPAPSELLNNLDIAGLGEFSSAHETSDVIPIAEIESRLHAAPLGLSREARHLVLAAFVAQRQYEFVTSNGNRINHRSLDLQIIWDDIIGIARPLNEAYAPERLLSWAKLLTGNSEIKSLDRTEDRLLIIDSLSKWLESWKNGRVLAEFDALPDEILSA
ncbi:MAG: hypothetical protein ABIV48_06510, partial [Pyrinomonadaceae bacterium]